MDKNSKMTMMFMIGLSISLFTTWEYEIFLIAIMYISAYIIDVDDLNVLDNSPMILIYGAGAIIGSVVALKFPEYFSTFSLEIVKG